MIWKGLWHAAFSLWVSKVCKTNVINNEWKALKGNSVFISLHSQFYQIKLIWTEGEVLPWCVMRYGGGCAIKSSLNVEWVTKVKMLFPSLFLGDQSSGISALKATFSKKCKEKFSIFWKCFKLFQGWNTYVGIHKITSCLYTCLKLIWTEEKFPYRWKYS